MMNKTVKSLVPKWWSSKGITSEQSIIELGKTSIQEMIKSHMSDVNGDKSHIKELQKNIAVLSSGIWVKESKKSFEPSQDMFTLVRDDNYGKEFKPNHPKLYGLVDGDTTCSMCGWCKYRGGGSYVGGYMISGSCDFFSNAGLDRRCLVNTICLLKYCNPKDIKSLVDKLKKKLKFVESEVINSTKKIISLKKLMLKASSKVPVGFDNRPCDWFNIGDAAVFYVGGWKGDAKLLTTDKFIPCKIINGYRHQDGCVSTVAEIKVHDGSNLDGYGLASGMSRPEVMLKWEFDYLRSNLKFAKKWADCRSERSEFDLNTFIIDLIDYNNK
jgi:hypothetical protein